MTVEPVDDIAEDTILVMAFAFTTWLEFLFNTGKAQHAGGG